MTELYIFNMGQFVHQNKAESMDFYPGCLQDNFVFACKRGYAFCYEKYLNEWSSVHEAFFVPYGSKEAQELWDISIHPPRVGRDIIRRDCKRVRVQNSYNDRYHYETVYSPERFRVIDF